MDNGKEKWLTGCLNQKSKRSRQAGRVNQNQEEEMLYVDFCGYGIFLLKKSRRRVSPTNTNFFHSPKTRLYNSPKGLGLRCRSSTSQCLSFSRDKTSLCSLRYTQTQSQRTLSYSYNAKGSD